MPIQVKRPKGTRDWDGSGIVLREAMFSKIRKVFENHNGKEIDTPVFELKNILTDKYDLTVPSARWLAMNNVRQIKRFQIGKLYRRDQPAIDRGRMREFYQCDFDYAGALNLMIPDAEILCITAEVFESLDPDVTIKVKHRLVLDGIFSAVGVPANLLRTISSAVDKLDKLPWDEMKTEMMQKGLDGEVADKIGIYVTTAESRSDFSKTLDFLRSDDLLSKNEQVKKGVEEMELLLRYLQASGIAQYVSFDLSLARGLDYYTGLIYEVTPSDSSLNVGSIAAGGRYDKLVGTFCRREIPCVGISFGIDRSFTILGAMSPEPTPSKIDVCIVAYGSNLLVERKLSTARQLRRAGISVEFDTEANRNPRKQVELAESNGAVVTILLEDDASAVDSVRVKIVATRSGRVEDEVVIEQAALVKEVQKRLS